MKRCDAGHDSGEIWHRDAENLPVGDLAIQDDSDAR